MEPLLDYDKWKLRASEQQQAFYSLLGNREWDSLDVKGPKFSSNLQLKTAFAFYARPYANCTADHQIWVDSVVDKIRILSESLKVKNNFLFLGYTYVSTWNGINDGIIPLLRVKFNRDTVCFIEIKNDNVQVYSRWIDYLENIDLADVNICYPKDGIYRGFKSVVLLEYGPVYSAPKNDFQSPKISLFFPFAEAFSSGTLINFQRPEINVNVKKMPNACNPCKSLNALAIWFKFIAPNLGSILENEDEISVVIETGEAITAAELFKLFYVTPYNSNGHFAVVFLMKILTIHVVGKMNDELRKEFSDMLNFILHVYQHTYNVEELIRVLNEDHFPLNHPLNLVLNLEGGFKYERALEYLRGDAGILKTRDLITNRVENEREFESEIKPFIVKLIRIIREKKYADVKIFGPLALRAFDEQFRDISSSGLRYDTIGGKLYFSFVKEGETRIETLRGTLNQTRDAEEYLENIQNYPLHVLTVLFNCILKVEKVKLDNHFRAQFLKFLIHCLDFIENNDDLIGVILFITEKFIAMYQAFSVNIWQGSQIYIPLIENKTYFIIVSPI